MPPPLIAFAGWVIPGAGYWLIGERGRAIVVFTAILVLYLLGLLVAGVRVIEVPGYDPQGAQIRVLGDRRVSPNSAYEYSRARWIMTGGGFISEIANKPWFVGQVLAGPIALASAAGSVQLAQRGAETYPRPHAPLETVGTLYTAIAGMLNLMVIIDAAHRAGEPRGEAV